MAKIIKIFIERDGLTPFEAKCEAACLKAEVLHFIGVGNYEEAEDILRDYGFEVDYFFNLIE